MADLNYKANWATHWNSNAPPALAPIAQQSTNEDTARSITVTASDDITPGTQVQLSAQVISGTNVVTNAGISFGTPNASGVRTMTINPIANASGTARIRVTATDAGGISSTQEFDIVVNGVADTPIVTQFASLGRDVRQRCRDCAEPRHQLPRWRWLGNPWKSGSPASLRVRH